jgi:hypothetical protein
LENLGAIADSPRITNEKGGTNDSITS